MSKDWVGNSASVFKGIGATNHAEGDRADKDFYATSPEAIDALKKKVDLPHFILEPSCGQGHLSERLKELGHEVWSYDIVDRGYGEVQNFFEMLSLPSTLSLSLQNGHSERFAIVTNPPYNVALPFILHALELCREGDLVCMFVKTTFLEGKKRYKELFSQQPPFMVLQFVERILCAKNGDFEEARRLGSAVSYMWAVWEKGFKGKTIVDWI